jgi:hypothetical protein
MKSRIQYEDYYVAPARVSTAIYDYLENKGIKVNRKSGTTPQHKSFWTAVLWCLGKN